MLKPEVTKLMVASCQQTAALVVMGSELTVL